MPAEGWQGISGLEQPGIEEMLWSYHGKINLYIPPNIVGRLGYWSYYTKNNESDWATVWVGVNKEWELADKTYIVIMKAN